MENIDTTQQKIPQQPALAVPITEIPQTPVKKLGKSRHFIIILFFLFPPLAWYYMWKEQRYHNWFASVLIIDGLLFIGTSISLIATFYPPITMLYESLFIPKPFLYDATPYIFIVIGVIEILYGIFLRIEVARHKILSNILLTIAILFLSIHFIGLPLSQIYSYFSVATTTYNLNIHDFNTRKATSLQLTPTATPQPTHNPTATWKTYTNLKYSYSLKYPPTWNIADSTQNSSNISTTSALSLNSPCNYDNGENCATLDLVFSKAIASEGLNPAHIIDGKIISKKISTLDDSTAQELIWYQESYGTGDPKTSGRLLYELTAIHNADRIDMSYEEVQKNIVFRKVVQWHSKKTLDQILSSFKFSSRNQKMTWVTSSEKQKDFPFMSFTIDHPNNLELIPSGILQYTLARSDVEDVIDGDLMLNIAVNNNNDDSFDTTVKKYKKDLTNISTTTIPDGILLSGIRNQEHVHRAIIQIGEIISVISHEEKTVSNDDFIRIVKSFKITSKPVYVNKEYYSEQPH